jgi:uncharacterized protein (TIGR00297 family)
MPIELTPVSSSEWLLFAAMLFGLFAFVGAAEVLRKTTSLTGNTTRIIVHVLVGVFVFFVPLLFISPVPGILMSILFIVINYLSIRARLFKGMDDTTRETYGTVYFPISFLLLIILFWDTYPVIIATSILILGLADGAASAVGQAVRTPRRFNISGAGKSYEGSIAMWTVALCVSIVCLALYPHDIHYTANGLASPWRFILSVSLVVAVVVTVIEAMSARGLDNLFVPLGAAIILYVALDGSAGTANQLFAGFLFALLISLISFRVGFLSRSGAAAIFLMAVIIFGIGGWKWTIPMLTFFILSSIISRMKNKRKEAAEQYFEKSHKRDMGQVAANGGLASLFVIGEFAAPDPLWYVAYLGAIAAATADTWGTEFGISFSSTARDILSFKKVPAGLSGGVSAIGLLAGVAGGTVIGLSGFIWLLYARGEYLSPYVIIGIVAGAGIIGSIVDSIIGAALQSQYRCSVCNKVTERREHCGAPGRNVHGYRWITNDYVNIGCTAVGSFTAVILFLLS